MWGIITLDNAGSLLKNIGRGKISGYKFKKEYNNIVDDVALIFKKSNIIIGQEKMVETLSLLKEIIAELTDEQRDTTDMPELKNEESAEQNRKQKSVGLKILTSDQILSRLPISLGQLKAGNNSKKLKN